MLQTVFEIGADPRKSTVKAGAPDLFGGLPERVAAGLTKVRISRTRPDRRDLSLSVWPRDYDATDERGRLGSIGRS